MNPSLIELSSRRYPFDVLPARTWRAWLELWELKDPGIGEERLTEFWAPTDPDRALAWDLYVELKTRITTQELKDDEGDDTTALKSVYQLFPMSRKFFHRHGVGCANAATLITAFLNEKIRRFTLVAKQFSMQAGEITPTLKVRRKVVAEKYHELIERMYGAPEPPEGDTPA